MTTTQNIKEKLNEHYYNYLQSGISPQAYWEKNVDGIQEIQEKSKFISMAYYIRSKFHGATRKKPSFKEQLFEIPKEESPKNEVMVIPEPKQPEEKIFSFNGIKIIYNSSCDTNLIKKIIEVLI